MLEGWVIRDTIKTTSFVLRISKIFSEHISSYHKYICLYQWEHFYCLMHLPVFPFTGYQQYMELPYMVYTFHVL